VQGPGLVRARGFAAFCALLAILPGLAACDREVKQPPKKEPPQVTFITVEPKDAPVVIDFVAQSESSHAVQINARVNGFLDKREFQEGSLVHEGDVLFRMDQKPFLAELADVKAALVRQQAAFEVAKANLARVTTLAGLNALSQKDLDDARGRYEETAAAVEQAKAVVTKAELNLSYTVITSPITGLAAAAQQQDGTYISVQNAALTTVSVVTPMWINFSVSQNQLSGWRDEGAAGTLRGPADGRFVFKVVMPDKQVYPHEGKVTFTSPSYDAKTGTFLVRGIIDNPDGTIKPNQFVTARVVSLTRPGAILVPQRAVHQGENGHFVWVIDKDGKSEFRPVRTGDWQGDDWFITAGLKPDERVIVDGLVFQPGIPVNPEPLPADTKSPPASE
jgi:membrane fusion protein, multidrug efflux system